MLVNPQDEQTLQRLLGVEELPDDLVAEYKLRIGMYHGACGATGPLGAIGLIDLVRYLKRRPPEVKQSEAKTDWTRIPRGARVEARFFGGWQPGEFCGFVQFGTLDIRMDSDGCHRECRPDMVRLASEQTAIPAGDSATVEKIDPCSKSDQASKSDIVSQTATIQQAITEVKSLQTPDVVTAETDPDYLTLRPGEVSRRQSDTDWSAVSEGETVWLDTGDDIVDVKFLRTAEEGTVTVLLDGKEIQAAQSNCTLPGAQKAALAV